MKTYCSAILCQLIRKRSGYVIHQHRYLTISNSQISKKTFRTFSHSRQKFNRSFHYTKRHQHSHWNFETHQWYVSCKHPSNHIDRLGRCDLWKKSKRSGSVISRRIAAKFWKKRTRKSQIRLSQWSETSDCWSRGERSAPNLQKVGYCVWSSSFNDLSNHHKIWRWNL